MGLAVQLALSLVVFVRGSLQVEYRSKQQLFVAANQIQQLKFSFSKDQNTESILPTVHLENVGYQH